MASEPPRPPSGPKLGPKLGFDESEQKEFTRALRQGLLVQTPLQVLLETLFSRMQLQAGLFADLSRRVERMEARDLDSHELLLRLQLCEGKVSALSASKLSPFAQQEILERLDRLEKQTQAQPPQQQQQQQTQAAGGEGGEAEAAPMADGEVQQGPEGLAGLEARLGAVEGKLTGVYNLGGRLIALDHMAARMGVDVPDLEYNPGMLIDGFLPPRPSITSLTAAAMPFPSPTTGFSSPDLRAPSTSADASTSAPASPTRKGGAPSLQPVSEQSTLAAQESGAASPTPGGQAGRGAELSLQVAEVTAANEALRATVEALTVELHRARGELSQRQERLAGRVLDLETGTQGLNKQLTEQGGKVQAPRRDGNEISYADFSLLQSQVMAAVRDVQGARDAVSSIREQDLRLLGDTIAELRESCKRIDAPRDMDNLFHQRLSALEARYADLRGEVQAAAAEALQGVAHVSDIETLAREVEAKASLHDIRQLATQQQTLAQSVNGMAEWLAVRPEHADGVKGTGSSATKFKCLTCDREMRTQYGFNGNPTLKGSFLPKLEGMHGTAAAVPAGPGLNSARNTGRISPGATRGTWTQGQDAPQAPPPPPEDLGPEGLPPVAPTLGGPDPGVGSPGLKQAGVPPAGTAVPGAGPQPVKLPPGPATRTPVFMG